MMNHLMWVEDINIVWESSSWFTFGLLENKTCFVNKIALLCKCSNLMKEIKLLDRPSVIMTIKQHVDYINSFKRVNKKKTTIGTII